uniref:Putative secreted protein n=1 Tax=Anopheles marajoara TaxID=58244 RepID=A0A2M4CAA2_9DIPT
MCASALVVVQCVRCARSRLLSLSSSVRCPSRCHSAKFSTNDRFDSSGSTCLEGQNRWQDTHGEDGRSLLSGNGTTGTVRTTEYRPS